jgi:TRAP-type C4-dicarboxylate transport system permease small subunit
MTNLATPQNPAGARNPARSFQRVVAKLEDGLCILGLSVLVGLVAMQIVGRFTPWSLPWTEEVARYVFIWTVMIGMAAATREKEHVALELGDRALPVRVVASIRAVAGLASLSFFALLFVLGMQQSRIQMVGDNLASSLPLPLWIVSASIPLAALLAAIWTLREVLAAFRDSEPVE